MRGFSQRAFTTVSHTVLKRGRATALAISASCVVVPLACAGGPAASGGLQSPATTAASASAPPSAEGAETTTTAALADTGDSRGTKLTETDAGAPASAGAASPPKSAHGHDPGRGSSDIGAIIKAHRGEARACYERALTDHPGIEGDLVISWTIDPEGKVSQAALDASRSQITEPSVVACVLEILRKIQFAPSPAGFETRASYPFNFQLRHGRPSPGS